RVQPTVPPAGSGTPRGVRPETLYRFDANSGGTVSLLPHPAAPPRSRRHLPCELFQPPRLTAACGDVVRRLGGRGLRRGGPRPATCTSLGRPSGALRCSATYTFDTSG